MESSQKPWIERVKRALAYHQEALEFLARASQQFPLSSPAHTPMVTKLWTTAEQLDPTICALMEELNRELLESGGELDTTQGVSLRENGQMSPEQEEPGQETLVYTCNWSLRWQNGEKSVLVNLEIDPGDGNLTLRFSGGQSRASRDLRYPSDEGAVEEALADIYIAEATVESMLQEIQQMADSLQVGEMPGDESPKKSSRDRAPSRQRKVRKKRGRRS